MTTEKFNDDYGFYIDVLNPLDTGIPYTIVVNAHYAYDDDLGPRIRVFKGNVAFPGFGQGTPIFFNDVSIVSQDVDQAICKVIKTNLDILLNYWYNKYENAIDSIEFRERFIKYED